MKKNQREKKKSEGQLDEAKFSSTDLKTNSKEGEGTHH